ncbi:MAG: conjugal transfer protein MobB [Rikenellaceae bacterium]
MVAEISYADAVYGILSYNIRKVENRDAVVISSNKLYSQGDKLSDISTASDEFSQCFPSSIVTKKPFIHISLNPHPDDVLSDNQLALIADEYLEKMGLNNQPYIIYKHTDIDRHHLHIVTLGVDSSGKKLSNSNNFFRSRKAVQELEQKYGLIPANRKKRGEVYKLGKVDPSKGDITRQVGTILRHVRSNFKFLSISEYKTLLSTYNVSVEHVQRNAQGKIYNGIVYSAIDNNGRKVGKPLKSSLYGKDYGIDGLTYKADRSKEEMKAKHLAARSKQTVLSIKNVAQNRADFEQRLSKRGIDMIVRENDNGRIYGLTFIDHTTGCVLNGSRLGKEFSANAMADWFNKIDSQYEQDMQNIQEREFVITARQGEENISREAHSPFEPIEHEYKGTDEELATGSALDIFSFADDGIDDIDEEQFRNAMQRKKKKKRGRRPF